MHFPHAAAIALLPTLALTTPVTKRQDFSGTGQLTLLRAADGTQAACLQADGIANTEGSCGTFTATPSSDGKTVTLSGSEGQCRQGSVQAWSSESTFLCSRNLEVGEPVTAFEIVSTQFGERLATEKSVDYRMDVIFTNPPATEFSLEAYTTEGAWEHFQIGWKAS